MQVNNFIKYLDHSEELKAVPENEIMPIIKEFPYCQTGQLMFAIQLNANNSILFEAQLKKVASICTDRKRIFDHIKNTQDQYVIENETISPNSPPKEIQSLKKEPVIKKETTPTKNDSNSETKKIKQESQLEKFIPVKGQDELSILEKEYLTEAISTTIMLEASDENAPLISEIDNPLADLEKEVSLFNENEDHSFSSWLQHYSGEKSVQKSTTKKKKNQDLINRFIQEDPRVKPKKTAFYSPTNMARLSVTNDGIVSETLAIIHVDQGNFQEAINTYKKLSLKNPKKRSYFAAQIKILKQKIK